MIPSTIKTFFSGAKLYLYSAIGLLVAGLAARAKYLAGKNKKLETENKIQGAHIKHTEKVMTADREIDEQTDVHLAEVTNEINETGVSDELSNPNEWGDE